MSTEDKAKARKRSLANIIEYQKTFATEHGKKVLWDLMKESGMLRNNFTPGDSHATSFNEGGRVIVLHILNKINTNVQLLEKNIDLELEKENLNIFGEVTADV